MTLRSRVEKIANAELIKVQYPDYVSIEKETIALIWSVIRDYQQLLDRAMQGLEAIIDVENDCYADVLAIETLADIRKSLGDTNG